jgi:hypothetical protein
MEIILVMFGKLEYLKSIVKLTRKNCDEGLNLMNPIKVEGSHAMHKININKNHCSKLLHLVVEINNHLVEGLVDIVASMFEKFANVVQKIGIIYLIVGSKAYKTAYGVVIQAFGRINELHVKVGDIQCLMNIMIINTNNYDG